MGAQFGAQFGGSISPLEENRRNPFKSVGKSPAISRHEFYASRHIFPTHFVLVPDTFPVKNGHPDTNFLDPDTDPPAQGPPFFSRHKFAESRHKSRWRVWARPEGLGLGQRHGKAWSLLDWATPGSPKRHPQAGQTGLVHWYHGPHAHRANACQMDEGEGQAGATFLGQPAPTCHAHSASLLPCQFQNDLARPLAPLQWAPRHDLKRDRRMPRHNR